MDHSPAKYAAEQVEIGLVRRLRVNGKPLRAIADELNRRLIPTRNNGLWRAATMKKPLDRAATLTLVEAVVLRSLS